MIIQPLKETKLFHHNSLKNMNNHKKGNDTESISNINAIVSSLDKTQLEKLKMIKN